MLKEVPLFWFEYSVIYHQNRFWLVEYCVWFDGHKDVMEMVEIRENLDGYIQEVQQGN